MDQLSANPKFVKQLGAGVDKYFRQISDMLKTAQHRINQKQKKEKEESAGRKTELSETKEFRDQVSAYLNERKAGKQLPVSDLAEQAANDGLLETAVAKIGDQENQGYQGDRGDQGSREHQGKNKQEMAFANGVRTNAELIKKHNGNSDLA
jgi:vacuolar-type H+-ATPase subunit I/STV1